MKKIICFFSIIFFFSLLDLNSISFEFYFKKGNLLSPDKYLNVFLCNEYGEEMITANDFNELEYIYFCYNPIGNWHFSGKELKNEIAQIKIKQNEKIIKKTSIEPIYEQRKIKKIVVKFPKSDFDFSKKFLFIKDLNRSELLKFNEEFWPNYQKLHKEFLLGEKLFIEGKYLQSYQQLKDFIDNSEIIYYSFYKESISLMSNCIRKFISNTDFEFKIANIKLKNQFGEIEMAKIDSIYSKLKTVETEFSFFFDFKSNTDTNNLKKTLTDLIDQVEQIKLESEEKYKKQILSIFEINNYDNEKFKFFVNSIAYTLCFIDSFRIQTTLNSIPSNNISKFPELYEKLSILEWQEDFFYIISLLDKNIRQNSFILNKYAMQNLEYLKGNEEQPYYNIFCAFNALVIGDLTIFSENIKQAITKCTDINLLKYLEFWILSYKASVIQISESVLNCLNLGLHYENNNDFDNAEIQFKKAKNWANTFAPPLYYLGRINHRKGKTVISEIYFSDALDMYPQYIDPVLFLTNSLIEKNEADLALKEINIALEKNPIWYFYYKKAEILFLLNQYTDAQMILEEKCLPINSQNFNEYILLGDLCMKQSNVEKAKNYYQKAGNLDFENPAFLERMKTLE